MNNFYFECQRQNNSEEHELPKRIRRNIRQNCATIKNIKKKLQKKNRNNFVCLHSLSIHHHIRINWPPQPLP